MISPFEKIMEIIGWLRIVASPLITGLIVGAFIYLPNPTDTRLIIGISVAVLGLIIGILWATSVWKKNGTINFLSKTMATPELDKLVQDAEGEPGGGSQDSGVGSR